MTITEFNKFLETLPRRELLKLTRAWGFSAHAMSNTELRKFLIGLKVRNSEAQ